MILLFINLTRSVYSVCSVVSFCSGLKHALPPVASSHVPLVVRAIARIALLADHTRHHTGGAGSKSALQCVTLRLHWFYPLISDVGSKSAKSSKEYGSALSPVYCY